MYSIRLTLSFSLSHNNVCMFVGVCLQLQVDLSEERAAYVHGLVACPSTEDSRRPVGGVQRGMQPAGLLIHPALCHRHHHSHSHRPCNHHYNFLPPAPAAAMLATGTVVRTLPATVAPPKSAAVPSTVASAIPAAMVMICCEMHKIITRSLIVLRQ